MGWSGPDPHRPSVRPARDLSDAGVACDAELGPEMRDSVLWPSLAAGVEHSRVSILDQKKVTLLSQGGALGRLVSSMEFRRIGFQHTGLACGVGVGLGFQDPSLCSEEQGAVEKLRRAGEGEHRHTLGNF